MTLLIMLVAPIVNSLLKVNALVIVEVAQTSMIAMISSNFLFFQDPPTHPEITRFARLPEPLSLASPTQRGPSNHRPRHRRYE